MTIVYWGDIYGRDADGGEIVRRWHAEQPNMALPDFCAHLSRAIWGEDHDHDDAVDWLEIARQVKRDALHGDS